jgi:hypothetical protein
MKCVGELSMEDVAPTSRIEKELSKPRHYQARRLRRTTCAPCCNTSQDLRVVGEAVAHGSQPAQWRWTASAIGPSRSKLLLGRVRGKSNSNTPSKSPERWTSDLHQLVESCYQHGQAMALLVFLVVERPSGSQDRKPGGSQRQLRRHGRELHFHFGPR